MTSNRIIEADYPPIMIVQFKALRAYAAQHGRTWKEDLRKDWQLASAPPLLHHLRNTHGPYWLNKFTLQQTSLSTTTLAPKRHRHTHQAPGAKV
jgi:hypothetical protein